MRCTNNMLVYCWVIWESGTIKSESGIFVYSMGISIEVWVAPESSFKATMHIVPLLCYVSLPTSSAWGCSFAKFIQAIRNSDLVFSQGLSKSRCTHTYCFAFVGLQCLHKKEKELVFHRPQAPQSIRIHTQICPFLYSYNYHLQQMHQHPYLFHHRRIKQI